MRGGGDVDPGECQPWGGGGGLCRGRAERLVSERVGEGAPPAPFLLVTPPAHCILGASFCSFQNPRLGLP